MTALIQLPAGDLHDFDFLDGEWVVQNRYLRSRLSGDHVWEEFLGCSRVELRMGSLVNVDEIDFPTRGFSGMTVRLFDVQERRWSTTGPIPGARCSARRCAAGSTALGASSSATTWRAVAR